MDKDFRTQARALVAQMTLEEAAGQLRYDAPAIDRLGVPAYNWWNEALHGVARAGTATVFPQAIALGAGFDPEMIRRIAEVIATEARAKYNMQSAAGDRDIYKGLTMWSPNINIFRDPRWGRGQETYGEDPYLTARLGVAFIKALQGEGEHMKAAACAKHYAVHSGPEALRHSFDAVVGDKDLYETYLPAFEAAVREGGVEAVMGAYNRTNGEPCCGSERLLVDILRGDWGFTGHVVSDCWALLDFHEHHYVTDSLLESAALALNNGCDLNCGSVYQGMMDAYEHGLVSEETIREAAVRLMTTRYKLGILGSGSEYDAIPYTAADTPEHRALALETAEKTAVLLKNDGILPLRAESIKTIAVIGPNADSIGALEGNYAGTASGYITNLEGIRAAVGGGARVLYSQGCHLFKEKVGGLAGPRDRLAEAAACAREADLTVLCLGLDAGIEGEQGDTGNSFAAGDRPNLYLPDSQRELLDTVLDTGASVVLVLNIGSPVDLDGRDARCAAVLQAWYSGQEGGAALANILFGKVSPSGRLPISFVKEGTLPEFTNYAMAGRTYRYENGNVLYPFGFGLSYTRFAYSGLELGEVGPQGCSAAVTVQNVGETASDEVVQLYLRTHAAGMAENAANGSYATLLNAENQPHHSLCGMKRVHLAPGQSATLRFGISAHSLQTVLENGERVVLKGEYTLFAGGSQPDARSRALCAAAPLSVDFML